MNSDGGHAHIDSGRRAPVCYCAIPALDEEEEVNGGDREEDGSAEADTLPSVGDNKMVKLLNH